MPNGRTHRKVGAAVGGAAALYQARDESVRAMALEALGGICGGILGGMLPDRLDPPVGPRHRGACHSLILLLVIAFLVFDSQRRACREGAAEAQRVGPSGPHPTLESDVWLFAAGFITGVQWGYVSHLAADMTTSAGLPLLVGRF